MWCSSCSSLLSPSDTGTLRSLMSIACQSFLLPSISIYFGIFNVFLSLQLPGSLDILQGFVSVAEATYLWESNSNVGSPLVLPHQSPTFSPMVDAHTRWNKPSGFAQLELSRILHLLVAVCLDGIIILCSAIEKGLSHANEITPERWGDVFDVMCAFLVHEQQF